MTTLEDLSRAAPLSPWAERRLQLLRWMLIDNAQSATRDSQVDVCASPLAKALFEALEARDLSGMAEAAKTVDHPDAALTARALERLAREAQKQGSAEAADKRTVQHIGRVAAAMQLHMTSFESARAVYEQMLTKAAEPEVAQLLVAVQGVERVLIGRPFSHRSFAVPKANRFEDVTVRHPEQRALASTPAAIGGTHEGLGFDDQTRVAASSEIPLAAFGDEVTRAIVLPEAHIETAAARAFGSEVTSVNAHVASVDAIDFDDLTVSRSPVPAVASTAFVTGDTLSIERAPLLAALDAPTIPDAAEAATPPEVRTPSAATPGAVPPGTTIKDVHPKAPPQERPNRNSVVVSAIVSVGTLEKTK
jgi:hypothetical protein